MNCDIPLILPDWNAPPNVVAYCTTRQGGVSKGSYAGLNVGMHVGDAPEAVLLNRQRLPAYQHIHWLNQVHGCQALELPCDQSDADASVSRSTDAFCAVMTADCVPVLICNKAGTEVAAIHAGWKGLQLQIIAHTLAKLNSQPGDLMAWIGPAISRQCYEVPDAVAQFFRSYPDAVTASANPDRYLIDLPLVARYQLHELGVGDVCSSALCTYQDQRFYSHRRATHDGDAQTGRMVSVIGLNS